jgi:hypothetical protein
MSSIDDNFGNLISKDIKREDSENVNFPEEPLGIKNRKQLHGEGTIGNEIKISHVGRLYVQRGTQQPEQININCNVYHPIDADEQVWRRLYKIGYSWEQIDLGWTVEDGRSPSRIIVKNLTGTDRGLIPSREQLEEDRLHKVQLRFEDSEFTIDLEPGDVQTIASKHIKNLRIRTTADETRVQVIALPG